MCPILINIGNILRLALRIYFVQLCCIRRNYISNETPKLFKILLYIKNSWNKIPRLHMMYISFIFEIFTIKLHNWRNILFKLKIFSINWWNISGWYWYNILKIKTSQYWGNISCECRQDYSWNSQYIFKIINITIYWPNVILIKTISRYSNSIVI